MSHTPKIATSDWIATRNDIWNANEDHKASLVGVLAFALGSIAILGNTHGIEGVISGLAISSIVLSAWKASNHATLSHVTRKHAPIRACVAKEIGKVSLDELSELIETNQVTIGKIVVKANIDSKGVVLTEQKQRRKDETIHVSTVRAQLDADRSMKSPF